MPEFFRASELADLFKVHEKTIYAWAARGELPSVRFGKRAIRFRREDVERLITDRLVPAGRPA
jgi:excisionase family DNA binding protein